jgi:hypothetical protein
MELITRVRIPYRSTTKIPMKKKIELNNIYGKRGRRVKQMNIFRYQSAELYESLTYT